MRIESFNLFSTKKYPLQIALLDSHGERLAGNKAYKLSSWIQQASAQQCGLLSCGGAWSNHLHALAAAGQDYALPTAALVRGYEPSRPTATLQDCLDWGMQLISVDRHIYSRRNEVGFADQYLRKLAFPALWVPEGGTDEQAVTACEQMGHELNQQLAAGHNFDAVWVAVGSGGTIAGIARSLDPAIKLFAVPVMSHWQAVAERVAALSAGSYQRIHWLDGAAYGGFGRMNKSMAAFMQVLEAVNSVQLDPVYTAKVARRLYDACFAGEEVGYRPLILHTGGLQGRRGMLC